MEKHKYPYEVLLDGAPNAYELDHQFSIDMEDGELGWWEKMTPDEAIQEVQEILDRYSPGSGWVHYEEIQEGSKRAIEERNQLRRVVKYMKKQKRKYYK